MGRRKRRHFTNQYKAEVVQLVRASGKSIGQVAREMDLTETAVRAWVRQAEVDRRRDPNGQLTSDEKAELTRLRRELKTVTMERDFLKNHRARQRRSRVGQKLAGRSTIARREEWPSSFWCSANP